MIYKIYLVHLVNPEILSKALSPLTISGANQARLRSVSHKSKHLQYSPHTRVRRLPTALHQARDTRSTSNQKLSRRLREALPCSKKQPYRSFPVKHQRRCATTLPFAHAKSS